MTLLRLFAIILLMACPVFLTSCLDGREEVWINADGSGKADLFYDVPASAAKLQGGITGVRTMLAGLMKDLPARAITINEQDDRLKIRVKFDFRSTDQITQLTESVEASNVPRSFDHLAGIFDVKRTPLGVDFTRTISPGKALPAAFIPADEFRNRKLTYILHLPVAASESTANRSENGGRTLTWEQPLASAIHKPIVVHFKAEIVPFWILALVATAAITVMTVFFVRFRKRKA